MNSEPQGVLYKREMLRVLIAVHFAHQSQMPRNGGATSFYAIFRKLSRSRNISIGTATINGRRTNTGRKYWARRSTGR
jgi:hypothetical protein